MIPGFAGRPGQVCWCARCAEKGSTGRAGRSTDGSISISCDLSWACARQKTVDLEGSFPALCTAVYSVRRPREEAHEW